MSILVRYTAMTLAVMLGATFAHADHHMPDCPNLSGANALKLTVDEYHLSLNNKKPICIVMGVPVKIRIHNPQSATYDVKEGDVTVEQKDSSPYKIEGDNWEDKDYLKLTVSALDGDAGDETECGDGSDECAKFWIAVKNVGQLDPMVRVVDGDVQMSNYRDILQEVLTDLDLTLDQAVGILESGEEGAK